LLRTTDWSISGGLGEARTKIPLLGIEAKLCSRSATARFSEWLAIHSPAQSLRAGAAVDNDATGYFARTGEGIIIAEAS